MENLWPENIGKDTQRTPITILREQASFLASRTKNIVIGEVRPVEKLTLVKTSENLRTDKEERLSDIIAPSISSSVLKSPLDGYDLKYGFYIVAPALLNYHFKVFDIYFNFDYYPLAVSLDIDIATELTPDPSSSSIVSIENEEQFVAYLKRIFAARKTNRVLASLLAQSTDDYSREEEDKVR